MGSAIVFRGERIAPAVFEDHIARAAAVLQAAGVAAGDVVALMMRNRPDTLALMLAVRRLGAQWCPVNWHFKSEEVAYILGDSGARVFVVDADLLAAMPGLSLAGVQAWVALQGSSPGMPQAPADHAVGLPLWAAACAASVPLPTAPVAPRGAMFYTSGTTGRPKGIRRAPATPEQAASGLAVLRHVLGFQAGMKALVSAPMYHSAPNSFAIGAAQEGAELYIEERFDAERTLQLIDGHRLSHAYLVPTMYVRLLRLPAEVRGRYDLSSMRFVSSTGSPCPPDVKRAMIAWWGPVIHEAYGSSELGYMTRLSSEEALRKPGSAGLPLPGVQLAILDDDGRPLPQGQAGSIYVHQPAYADFSYIGNEAARLRMERHGLKTLGDVGYLDEDGFLFIVDRAADMVISGGVNIYPAEIEAVLLGMPGVADCAVFGIPDAEFGETLLAAIQPEPGALPDAESVRAYLKPRLADFKLPRLVTLHEQLPREDTGKVFKRKLREPYWAGQQRRI
jgi:long-chain acyl-CoA synthetase